jgi:hypothetical protein
MTSERIEGSVASCENTPSVAESRSAGAVRQSLPAVGLWRFVEVPTHEEFVQRVRSRVPASTQILGYGVREGGYYRYGVLLWPIGGDGPELDSVEKWGDFFQQKLDDSYMYSRYADAGTTVVPGVGRVDSLREGECSVEFIERILEQWIDPADEKYFEGFDRDDIVWFGEMRYQTKDTTVGSWIAVEDAGIAYVENFL